jgi:hypothetical protein
VEEKCQASLPKIGPYTNRNVNTGIGVTVQGATPKKNRRTAGGFREKAHALATIQDFRDVNSKQLCTMLLHGRYRFTHGISLYTACPATTPLRLTEPFRPMLILSRCTDTQSTDGMDWDMISPDQWGEARTLATVTSNTTARRGDHRLLDRRQPGRTNAGSLRQFSTGLCHGHCHQPGTVLDPPGVVPDLSKKRN